MSSDTLSEPINFKTCRPVINQFRIGVQRHFVLLRVNLDRSMQDVESILFQKKFQWLQTASGALRHRSRLHGALL